MPLELRHRSTVRPPSALDPLEVLCQALARTRFGAVQLSIREGRVEQMDITEQRRFES
jgi:hypothetical protein